MGKRFKKAMQALMLILLITVACLAFMPWQLTDVVEPLEDATRCMILRDDQNYTIAYPADETLQQVIATLADSTGHFDRNRGQLTYWGEEPLYRIYLWTAEGRIPDIWLCGTAFYYEGAQYVLNEADADAINAALDACFS